MTDISIVLRDLENFNNEIKVAARKVGNSYSTYQYLVALIHFRMIDRSVFVINLPYLMTVYLNKELLIEGHPIISTILLQMLFYFGHFR